MFSERVPRSREPNRITQALRRARATSRPLIDLTVTNPTIVGLSYPPAIFDAMGSPRASAYAPQPFGLAEARRAVAGDYARRGVPIVPERIVLTASTSEAYSLLFKLLCDPGDSVLVPVPSYPLFDHLTALDEVRAISYPLEYHGQWSVAITDLDRCWNDSVRAVLAVSPNNPTGSVVREEELQALRSRCRARDAALIIDEVFCDYSLSDAPEATPSRRLADDALVFRLGGLSKSAGLPQMKLGWIAVEGPDAVVSEALERLEIICDAYLSVSTPVQVAAASLIEAGASVRAQLLARVRRNYSALRDSAASHPAVEVLAAEAGWSAVIRVPSTRSEEELIVELIDRDGVIVHPGFFFDFPHESFVIVSLLPEPGAFDEGLKRILERVDG